MKISTLRLTGFLLALTVVPACSPSKEEQLELPIANMYRDLDKTPEWHPVHGKDWFEERNDDKHYRYARGEYTVSERRNLDVCKINAALNANNGITQSVLLEVRDKAEYTASGEGDRESSTALTNTIKGHITGVERHDFFWEKYKHADGSYDYRCYVLVRMATKNWKQVVKLALKKMKRDPEKFEAKTGH